MTANIKVSVIIPVYNAQEYIYKCVHSVLRQPYVYEVILVEDGSSDRSRDFCQQLETTYDKVSLYLHSEGENCGAGRSRNLGISKATGELISFLDADDFFLEDRFVKTVDLFLRYQDIDGVYEVVGVRYDNEGAKQKHLMRMSNAKRNISNKSLPIGYTGIEFETSSNHLFLHLLKTDRGWIHLNGLTVRRNSLLNFPLFNDNCVGEDSEFINRLACEKKLIGIVSKSPVSIRRVHNTNRILNQSIVAAKPNTVVDWEYWIKYALCKSLNRNVYLYLLLRAADATTKGKKIINILRVLANYPELLYKVLRNG
ncbi:MAG: glycosyltransferase family 2 protein [Candidatus Electrothrix scaldis]|nr:MAG: glycosyltransferase family 2 protein [Candidatus Electrothrix sp. GW3-3]